MTLEPLLGAPPLVQAHAFLAVSAIALGTVRLAAPKGTLPHRTLGWTWIALITTMLIIAFFNHDIALWDPFGPGVCCREPDSCGGHAASCASIHLISIYFLLALPYGALHARRHDLVSHRNAMRWLFLGVLLVGTALGSCTTCCSVPSVQCVQLRHLVEASASPPASRDRAYCNSLWRTTSAIR
jgi:uncharacterized membrane protein